jgi:hypothetical protein
MFRPELKKVLAGTEKSSGRNFRLEPELIH